MKKILLVLGFLAGIAVYFFTRKKTGTSAVPTNDDSLLSGLTFPAYTSTGSYNSGGTIVNTGGGTTTEPTPTENNNVTAVSKTNLVKTIPFQTGLNNLNLSTFGTMNVKTFSDNGYLRPIWSIHMAISGKWFKDISKKPWQLGIAGSADVNSVDTDGSRSGWGTNGQDYFSPFVLQTYTTFVSTIPYQFRAQGDSGYGSTDIAPFNSSSTVLDAFEEGRNVAGSYHFGAGDNVAGGTGTYGVSKRGALWVDVETGHETGSPKHRALLMGMATNSLARVFSMYGCIFITLGYHQQGGVKFYHFYPDSSGNFDSSANISEDWRLNTVLSIPEKNITNKKLLDFPNILPSFEQSYHKISMAKQGSRYYLDSSNINYATINKFGSGANVTHPMAALAFNLEIHKWYCINKLNNRGVVCMAKLVCDRGALGAIDWILDQNGVARSDNSNNHENYQVGRRYAFAITSLLYMNSADHMVWDRSQDTHEGGSDTYTGVFGVYDMVLKSGGLDCYRDLTPRLWDSEYSLDGTTWKKTKGIDWDESTTTVLPYRDKIGFSGGAYKWEVMAWRTEGVEPTEFWARATINGVLRTIHVTPDMWETTNPTYTSTSLNAIPTADKEYFYQLYSFTA